MLTPAARNALLALPLAVFPAMPQAHPHVFVDTQVTLVFDADNALTGVRLVWTYDDFFSLLLTEELGLDPDGDLVLTGAEQEALAGFVLDWPADFTGDLLVAQGATPLALAERQDPAIVFEGGRVRESHFRPLAAPVAADLPVTVQVFDPFYYTAYTIVGEIAREGGADCAVTLVAADVDAAYARVSDMLGGRAAGDVGPDEAFPEVGRDFADTVTVTCDGSS
jgi:ABC-type uncharacterized transport system substrate-binding protein